MEQINEKQMKQERRKLMITAALIISLANILLVYTVWAFGIQIPPMLNTIVVLSVLAVVFVWLGKADNEIIARYYPEEGYSYGKALGRAVKAATLSGIPTALLMWLLYTFIDPAYVETIRELTIQTLPEAQQTDMAISMIEMIITFSTSFFGLLLSACLGQAFWGLLVALFTSLSVKQNSKIF